MHCHEVMRMWDGYTNALGDVSVSPGPLWTWSRCSCLAEVRRHARNSPSLQGDACTVVSTRARNASNSSGA